MFRVIKWVFIVVAVIIAVGVGLVLSRNSIAKTAIEQQIRSQTGMDVKMGSISTGILSPLATIRELTLYNPADFGGTPFLFVKEVHIEFDREALAHRELRFKLLKASISELVVVKNDLGQTNIVTLAANARIKPPTGAVDFRSIAVANLSISKISYLDLKNQKNNRARTVNLQNQVFRDLKSPADFYETFVTLWLKTGG